LNRASQGTASTRLELIALLFAAGLGIGLVFPLSKLASMSGISPLTYIGWSAFGASLVLFVLSKLTKNPVRVTLPNLRYAAVAGALTYAIPFGTLTFVVAHLGSGIPAILQSLTPMFTLALVSVMRMERLGVYRVVGLLLGLAGVLVIIALRDSVSAHSASVLWLALAFVTPLALACGNVYRSRAWPPGERPAALAAMTFGAAAILTLVLEAASQIATGGSSFASISVALPIIAAQSLASGFGYFFFFRLQKAGGPVYLSQISYVNTTVGVVFAAILFGEPIGAKTIFAVALIFAGIAFVNFGTRRQNAETRAID
jgi:drug/metabolite transporter (DMT)-like permease